MITNKFNFIIFKRNLVRIQKLNQLNLCNVNYFQFETNKKINYNIVYSRKFSTQNDTSTKRYDYDYQAPEVQDLNLRKIGTKIITGLFIIFSTLGLLYIILFRKYNQISKRNNFYLINEYFELKIANYISDKIKKTFENSLYKSNTEEVKLVFNIYKRILEKNKINLEIDISNVNVIDSISIGAFLCKNGDLFISNRIIEIAENNEDEIALFIGVEIMSNLMGYFTNRVVNIFIYNYFFPDFFTTKMKKTSFFSHKIDILNSYNRFLYFYPESVIGTYYEESDLIIKSIQILNKAEFNFFQSVEFLKKFEEKMKHYPQHYMGDVFINRDSRYYEMAKNYLKVYLI